MNNEVNNVNQNNLNSENNLSNENKKGYSKIIIIVLVVLLVGALGFICYDKFINKEKPPVPTPTPTSTPTPTPTTKNDALTILKTIQLTNKNQSISISGKVYNIRIDKSVETDVAGSLYINDVAVLNNDGSELAVATVYVTDNYAFFAGHGQFEICIEYAIDSEGKQIKVEDNNYYIHDIHLDNGLIVGKGMTVTDALDEDSNAAEVELIVKYENNKITVTKK